jgi:thiamine pyrophosphokinase
MSAAGGRCVIVAAAPLTPTPGLRARLAGGRALAADGGARAALALGLRPELVIGDLDSIDGATLARLRELGTPIESYPTDKDATDSELALRRALDWGAREIIMAGGLGGDRLDHGLANVLLLTAPELAGRRVVLLDNRAEATLLRAGERYAWQGRAGELVTLLPIDGDAEGVTTHGLRWALAEARLARARTRGVSNETVSGRGWVCLERGCLLLVRTLAPDHADWLVAAEEETTA